MENIEAAGTPSRDIAILNPLGPSDAQISQTVGWETNVSSVVSRGGGYIATVNERVCNHRLLQEVMIAFPFVTKSCRDDLTN